MSEKKRVPKLKPKKRRVVEPESLTAALNWDILSDPGDGWNPPVRNPRHPDKK